MRLIYCQHIGNENNWLGQIVLVVTNTVIDANLV